MQQGEKMKVAGVSLTEHSCVIVVLDNDSGAVQAHAPIDRILLDNIGEQNELKALFTLLSALTKEMRIERILLSVRRTPPWRRSARSYQAEALIKLLPVKVISLNSRDTQRATMPSGLNEPRFSYQREAYKAALAGLRQA
jgi:hypothetical protein